MLSRALSLATVMLLIGCFSTKPAQAQATNLEAGKAPSQIFAGTCTACHKSPRGLLKTVSPGSLPGFLRQHYTTSPDMASSLSSFLISNGASDTRYGSGPAKPDKDAKSDGKPGSAPEQLDRQGRRLRTAPPQEAAKPEAPPQQAAKPDSDGLSQGEAGRPGRNAKRLARPGEAPDAGKPTAEGQAAGSERGPDGRKLTAKQRLSKRGKPGSEEPPKDATKMEPAKGEPGKDDKPAAETAKDEGSKPEGAKPSGDGKSEPAKSESTKTDAPKETGGETPASRADPVPAVTPAPPASAASTAAPGNAPERSPAPSATTASSAPAAAPPAVAAPPAAPAPAAMTTAPQPAATNGPPAPPISQ